MTPEECRKLIDEGNNPLEVSIKKWEDNVNWLVDNIPPPYYGADNCGLCLVYFTEDSDEDDCQGCPVFAHTRRIGCMGSPYEEYMKELSTKEPNIELLRIHANEELEFLKSLRKINE